MNSRADDLDRFYGILDDLADRSGGPRRLVDCTRSSGWPERGVYFFFEPCEYRTGSDRPRVVRVGTHALRPSKSTLWSRLSTHRGNRGGSLPGGGNHRGSIFRLHVGTALLATGDWPDEVQASWGQGGTAPRPVRVQEYDLERAVSEYIGAMPFLWLEADDPPGVNSDRGVIEVGSIALLSNCDRLPIDPPSADWLGHHADRATIRASGLWNVNHVQDRHDQGVLDVLERYVGRMVGT